ncbi:peroxiredoxin family protein [Niallia sp. 03133]|uniref:peroxiredoxin family protein n=1 Tax=Niallia sp. 03133 TaxID=3458060 RepID=UPI004044566C
MEEQFERNEMMIKKMMCLSIFSILLMGHNVKAAQNDAKEIEVGDKAPDFTLNNLAGKTIRLSDFQGKIVMLNFWATWCPPCKKEMPIIQQFNKEKHEDVVILAVNIDGKEDVFDFVQNMQLTFPILLDDKDKVNELYKIITIPTTFFIDEKGIIQHKFYSAMPLEIMKEFTKKQ